MCDNLFVGNSAGVAGGGICVLSDTGLIANNTIVGNTAPADGNNTGGAFFIGNSTTATIENNLIALNSSGVVVDTRVTYNATYKNNDAYGNTAENYHNIADPTGTNGNISANPLFVNMAGGDYHLSAGSPAIDSGDDTAVQPGDVDLDGRPRIIGSHVDMGAFEYRTPTATFASALRALRIAAGLDAATTADSALNVETTGASASVIDVRDASRLARKAAGLDP